MRESNHPAVEYARRFIGTPYIYGGDGPSFDCSGLVCEVLKACGVIGPKEDLDCDALWERFKQFECSPAPGALALFGKSLADVTHVGIVSVDLWMVEAGGGDRTTVTEAAAQARHAMVRERPLSARVDLLTFVMPTYPFAER